MFKPLATSLVIFTLGFGSFVEAQEGRPKVRRVPSPAGTSTGGGGGAAPAMPTELEKNISITVSGKFAGDAPMDVTLTGCGRQFTTEAIVGSTEIAGNKIPSIASLHFTIRPTGFGYVVTYAIGTRIAIPTSTVSSIKGGNPATTNVSIGFEDVLVTGDVRLKPGAKIDIFKAGDDAVTLSLVEHDS